jgi:hypothetical protein
MWQQVNSCARTRPQKFVLTPLYHQLLASTASSGQARTTHIGLEVAAHVTGNVYSENTQHRGHRDTTFEINKHFDGYLSSIHSSIHQSKSQIKKQNLRARRTLSSPITPCFLISHANH